MNTWWWIYGGLFAVLLIASAVAAAAHPHSFRLEVVKGMRALGDFEGLPILFGVTAAFTILEQILPAAGPRKSLDEYWLNFKVQLLGSLIGPLFAALIGAATVALSHRLGLGWIDLRFSTGHGMLDLFLGFLLSTLIFDFFFYWYHRFQHESLLWQEHKLHHMDEQLCALYRESWLETLISGTVGGGASGPPVQTESGAGRHCGSDGHDMGHLHPHQSGCTSDLSRSS